MNNEIGWAEDWEKVNKGVKAIGSSDKLFVNSAVQTTNKNSR